MSDTLHFRRIRPQEGELYARFVHDFYASDGVEHPIPAEYIQRAFAEICRGDDYLICYILEENGDPAGYALLAKMYAQVGIQRRKMIVGDLRPMVEIRYFLTEKSTRNCIISSENAKN